MSRFGMRVERWFDGLFSDGAEYEPSAEDVEKIRARL